MTELGALLDDIPVGGSVYVDRDWLTPEAPHAVTQALSVHPDRGFRWGQGEWQPIPGELTPDRTAAALIEALAVAAVAVVDGLRPLHVSGRGLLAERIRTLAGAQPAQGTPQAAVDTTGRAKDIDNLCSVVQDMGSVVLAATPFGGTLALDLYSQVHRRGLSLVGVRDPVQPAAEVPNGDSAPAPLTEDGLPVDATWFVARG